jgi:hypothetical protein
VSGPMTRRLRAEHAQAHTLHFAASRTQLFMRLWLVVADGGVGVESAGAESGR